jgi:hypothetical protein
VNDPICEKYFFIEKQIQCCYSESNEKLKAGGAVCQEASVSEYRILGKSGETMAFI